MVPKHVGDANYNSWIGGPIRRFLCGLGGHELMRSYSPGRICLRCTSCPYESPGWVLKNRGESNGRRASGGFLDFIWQKPSTLSPR